MALYRPALWAELRRQGPGIHAISNLVTANDCANLLLAVGARPVMAQAPAEMEEITGAAAVTVLNLGTPDDGKFAAAILAGETANRLGHPVVLDPVGVGASRYRRRETERLLSRVRPDLIRANLAEVEALLGRPGGEQGVDSPTARRAYALEQARALAQALGTVVLLSGGADLITDGSQWTAVTGGSPRLRQITGAGCMLSVLCGALCAVTGAYPAAVNAALAWKACAQRAEEQIGPSGGLGALHMALFDQAELLWQRDTLPPEVTGSSSLDEPGPSCGQISFLS